VLPGKGLICIDNDAIPAHDDDRINRGVHKCPECCLPFMQFFLYRNNIRNITHHQVDNGGGTIGRIPRAFKTGRERRPVTPPDREGNDVFFGVPAQGEEILVPDFKAVLINEQTETVVNEVIPLNTKERCSGEIRPGYDCFFV